MYAFSFLLLVSLWILQCIEIRITNPLTLIFLVTPEPGVSVMTPQELSTTALELCSLSFNDLAQMQPFPNFGPLGHDLLFGFMNDDFFPSGFQMTAQQANGLPAVSNTPHTMNSLNTMFLMSERKTATNQGELEKRLGIQE